MTCIEIDNESEVQVPTTIKVTIHHHYDEQTKTGKTSTVWYFDRHVIAFQESGKSKTVIEVNPHTYWQLEHNSRLFVNDKLQKDAIERLEPNRANRLVSDEFYKKLDDMMDSIIPNAWIERKYFSM